MNLVHYERYLEFEARGLKRQATEAVRAFIDSFDEGEIEGWVREHLAELQRNSHGRIRHELFEALVFPVLKRGFLADDVPSILWLGRLIQNLYQARTLHSDLGWVTDTALFRRAFELEPDNVEARSLLLESQARWLSFCVHEWPAVILYGNAAADAAQCATIREELGFLRGLDTDGQYRDFFDEVLQCLQEYEARLAASERE